MTPEEREREALDVLHRIALALESISRHLFNIRELLRGLEPPESPR